MSFKSLKTLEGKTILCSTDSFSSVKGKLSWRNTQPGQKKTAATFSLATASCSSLKSGYREEVEEEN